jgi:hypothetical protein
MAVRPGLAGAATRCYPIAALDERLQLRGLRRRRRRRQGGVACRRVEPEEIWAQGARPPQPPFSGRLSRR